MYCNIEIEFFKAFKQNFNRLSKVSTLYSLKIYENQFSLKIFEIIDDFEK